VELSTIQEATGCAATQELSSLLWNLNLSLQNGYYTLSLNMPQASHDIFPLLEPFEFGY
jgi:hypothetical protein